MSESFNLFPTLSEEIVKDELKYLPISFTASYSRDFEEKPLIVKKDDEGTDFLWSGKLEDTEAQWNPDEYELDIEKKCKISDPSKLFGPKGVAPANSVIGIALMWISTKSDERGIIPFGEMTSKSGYCNYTAECHFDRGLLKGSLQLKTILYLKHISFLETGEKHLAHNTGTILGVLDEAELFLDGNGSLFPIYTTDIPNGPLWKVCYECSDPNEDPFDEENVRIVLNRCHPRFEELNVDGAVLDTSLFTEVLTSALMVITESIKEQFRNNYDWETFMRGDGFDEGSVAQALYYFINKLEWDVENPVKLCDSIHDFLARNLQGGKK